MNISFAILKTIRRVRSGLTSMLFCVTCLPDGIGIMENKLHYEQHGTVVIDIPKILHYKPTWRFHVIYLYNWCDMKINIFTNDYLTRKTVTYVKILVWFDSFRVLLVVSCGILPYVWTLHSIWILWYLKSASHHTCNESVGPNEPNIDKYWHFVIFLLIECMFCELPVTLSRQRRMLLSVPSTYSDPGVSIWLQAYESGTRMVGIIYSYQHAFWYSGTSQSSLNWQHSIRNEFQLLVWFDVKTSGPAVAPSFYNWHPNFCVD